MGEIQNQPFPLSFNASLRGAFQASCVTSDNILTRKNGLINPNIDVNLRPCW